MGRDKLILPSVDCAPLPYCLFLFLEYLASGATVVLGTTVVLVDRLRTGIRLICESFKEF